MRGITVTLYERVQTGMDEFNAPVYEEIPAEVENVLVAPASAPEIQDSLELNGGKAVYTLALPKGDSHSWERCRVRFFGQNWRVIGKPTEGIESLIPLSWNRKVQVESDGEGTV